MSHSSSKLDFLVVPQSLRTASPAGEPVFKHMSLWGTFPMHTTTGTKPLFLKHETLARVSRVPGSLLFASLWKVIWISSEFQPGHWFPCLSSDFQNYRWTWGFPECESCLSELSDGFPQDLHQSAKQLLLKRVSNLLINVAGNPLWERAEGCTSPRHQRCWHSRPEVN